MKVYLEVGKGKGLRSHALIILTVLCRTRLLESACPLDGGLLLPAESASSWPLGRMLEGGQGAGCVSIGSASMVVM